MIFTEYGQHIPKITANPVSTAIKNDIIASNYAFYFHRVLISKVTLCSARLVVGWTTILVSK